MPILAIDVGAENLNKYYLEQALLAYSINQPHGYLEKCKKINDFLNETIKDEIRDGVYNKRIKLSKEEYDEIFE